MPIKFEPKYDITPKIANYLMRIEAAKQQVLYLPMNPMVLASLRETARLYTTHYSTMIEGNSLSPKQVTEVIKHEGHFPGRERDEFEVKGYYSALTQEEYYALNLGAYYEAISIGGSHNYYMGRAEADITKWVEYFIEGIAVSFENVLQRMSEAGAKGLSDQSTLLRKLDPRQRKVLALLEEYEFVTSSQVGELFGFKPRTSSKICAEWVKSGFLEIVDYSRKSRKYKIAKLD
jgi:Fic family protein